MLHYTNENFIEDRERFEQDDIIRKFINTYNTTIVGDGIRLTVMIPRVNFFRKVIEVYNELVLGFEEDCSIHDVDWLMDNGLLTDEQHMHLDCYNENRNGNGKMGLRHRIFLMGQLQQFKQYVVDSGVNSHIKEVIFNSLRGKGTIPTMKEVLACIPLGGEFYTLLEDLSNKQTVKDMLKLNKSNRLVVYTFLNAHSNDTIGE